MPHALLSGVVPSRARSATPSGGSGAHPAGFGSGSDGRASPSPSTGRASPSADAMPPRRRPSTASSTRRGVADGDRGGPPERSSIRASTRSTPSRVSSSHSPSTSSSKASSFSKMKTFSSSSSSSSSPASLPAIACALGIFLPQQEDSEEKGKRHVTRLADEASRVSAELQSREQTLASLELQLGEARRVASEAADGNQSSNAVVEGLALKSEEAEHEAAVMQTRRISWDALRQRAAAERLQAAQAADAAKAEWAGVVKEGVEVRCESERATGRAADAARHLEAWFTYGHARHVIHQMWKTSFPK